MSDPRGQADGHVANARKILKKWIYLGDRNGDACRAFEKAANLYTMARAYDMAARTYQEMVPCFVKEDSRYDAACAQQHAAEMYKKMPGCEEDVVNAYTASADFFLTCGKFNRAAKCEVQVAEMLETQNKFNESVVHFRSAVEYFENDSLNSLATDCKKRIAHLHAIMEEYETAVTEFEEVGDYMVNDKAMKWSAKEFYIKACLCQFLRAGTDVDEEVENIRENFESYKDKDVHLDDTQESDFVEALLTAYEEENLRGFSVACRRYEEKIDAWMTKILLRMKRNFEGMLGDNM